MATIEDYKGKDTAWCPGCGNFGILKTFRDAMVELGLEPHQITIVSGIGQAGKFPHYVRCNTFNGLHGRTLPVAQALKLVNSGQVVIAVAGDGDCYGEGGNHLIHAMRRNVNLKLFVHDNQVYGLTKGQASPTTQEGTHPKNLPFGLLSEHMNPLALAVAMDCSFAARSFSGDPDHLRMMMKAAAEHKGFALLDILQPCVSFNTLNTFDWYRQRVYRLDDSHNPEDRAAAFAKALEWGDRIPVGIIYRSGRPTFDSMIPIIRERPLVDQDQAPRMSLIGDVLESYY